MIRVEAAPLVSRLRGVAIEFDAAATYYARFPGQHNDLLRAQSSRAATQLRVVALRVEKGGYSQTYGMDWLKAAHRIISAIGRENVR